VNKGLLEAKGRMLERNARATFRILATTLSLPDSGAGAWLPPMVRWLHVFFLIGLFAGLGMRASGAHFDLCSASQHQKACESSAGTEHDDDCPPSPHDHDHHHGECCQTPLWFASLVGAPALFPPDALAVRSLPLNESAPDGPVLALDKPPLI